MWRYIAGGLAALLLVAVGVLIQSRRATPVAPLLSAPAAGQQAAAVADPLPAEAPAAAEKTREQKRFDRYDKDRDGKVTREEYLTPRHKAFAKLDTNHDGVLSFDEWAAKTEKKFADADKDKSGALTPEEFATTKVQRKSKVRRDCPPARAAAPAEPAGEGE